MKKDNKNAVIIGLLVTIAFMSVGYALLSTKADRNELTTSLVDSYSDVSITTIISVDTEGTAEDVKSYISGDTELTLYPKINEKGDKVSYTINIKNNGNKKAELKSIKIRPVAEDYEIYSIQNISAGDELLPGDSKIFTFEVSFNNEYDGFVENTELKEVKVSLEYTK